MRRNAWWMVLQIAIVATVAFFVGRTFVNQWGELGRLGLSLGAHPGMVLLAAVVVWTAYLGLIFGWLGVLRGLGEKLDVWSAAGIWSLSSLGKYIPGKVWALAGMVVLAQRAGVRPVAATGSALVMQLLALATGSAVVALTGASTLTDARPEMRVGLSLLLLGSVLGTGLLLRPRVFERIVARLPGRAGAGAGGGVDGVVAPPTPGSIVAGLLANVVAWVAYGVAVWLLAKALLPETPFPLVGTIGAFTAAYIVGFLVLFIPGGLGVREGVFVLMLQGTVGLAAATAIAVASRLLFTATEVGIAIPFFVVPKGDTRGDT